MTLKQHGKRLGLSNLGEISTDSEAFIHNGAIYCMPCADHLFSPSPDSEDRFLLADSESDSPQTCDSCGILLPSDLTSYGWDYVRNTDGRTRAGKIYREAYPWVFR